MPLPPPAPRKLRHTRTVVCEGYERADGQWDVDGRLVDVKTDTIESWNHGLHAAGKPVHDMYLRLTVDNKMTITASEAAMDSHPWSICPNIVPNFAQLTGLALRPGFTKKVGALLGGINGCTHLGSLIGPVATTVMQTMVRARIKRMNEEQAQGRPRSMPHFLNTCHTWAASSPIVKREFPEFYKGE
ncbi:MAG: DUF2889 domain-containing protein [Rhodospirillaceae bacterium]